MAKSKTKILQEKNFEEFQLVNQNGGQYAGISEKDVTARQIETVDKTGKKVKIWRLYANNMRIATINASGRVVLTEEYKELLKNEQSLDADGKTIQGERWLQAMVPLKDRFSGKDIEDMRERTSKDIERIDMKQRIKEEEEKQESKHLANRKNITVSKDKKGPAQEQPKPEEIEKKLGLSKGDLEPCTVIKDKRFYDNVPEAKQAQGLSVLAYSKSKNEYIIISVDEKGNCKQLETVKPSKSTIEETTQVRKGKVQDTAVQNIMDVKGNNEVAYSAKINPGSSEIEFQELRIDRTEQGNNKYISSELTTSTQIPTREETEALSVENNASIVDEKEVIEDYEKAGIKVTKFEALTEQGRAENEILTMDEVQERISRKPKDIQDSVKQELQGMEAHEITQEQLAAIVEEKEQERQKQEEEDKARTPWGDAEQREESRRRA